MTNTPVSLLEAFDIKSAIITIDAMGCQHDVAAKIVASGADYVLGVKDNQPGLNEAVKPWFDAADGGTMDLPFWDDIQIGRDHGRIETRHCLVTNEVAWLGQQNQHCAGLQSLITIESTREIIGRNGTGTASVERRYYISSLGIAGQDCTGLHWVLDVAFREDDCRIRVGKATQNFAILRQIVLNLLKNEKTTKLGVAGKRLKAGRNSDYLAKVLGLAS